MDPMTRTTMLLPLLLLAGCGSGGGADDAQKGDPVAQVRTAPATAGAASLQSTLYGTAEAGPGGERSLIAPVETVVDRILAPNGTVVRAGQAVITLAPSRATALELAKASSDAMSADAAYARARRLRVDGLVSDADVETARAAEETARATCVHLDIGRGGLTVRAPIGGVVQGLAAKSGDQLAAGATIASIATKGDLRAHFGVDPAIAQTVRLGQPLELSSVSGGTHAAVSVDGIDQQVDPTTKLASVYADVPRGFGVGPGQALRASLSAAAQANGLSIPYAALLDNGGRSYVFVVTGGVAHARDVLPGNSSGDRIQILKGLAPGDKVVTEGGTALEDGMKVAEPGAPK
jgi:RND family efflux transporter MFP subunit